MLLPLLTLYTPPAGGEQAGQVFDGLSNSANQMTTGISGIKNMVGNAPAVFKMIFDGMPTELQAVITIGACAVVLAGIINALRGRK